MDGLIILSGPGVRKSELVKGASLVDLAPTIFTLLNVPIPNNLDGKVLDQAFDSDYKLNIKYEDGPVESKEDISTLDLSPEEEAQVIKRLRDLGYVS